MAERSPTREPINKISMDVAEAIAAGWLELWYQPKIDLRSFLVCGAEGLLRARHPDHGILAPAALIPPAGSPLHQPLARFVIRRAMLDWRCFADHRMSLKLAINLPVSVINAPDFMSTLLAAATDRPTISGASHRDHRGRGDQRSRLDLPGIHTIEALRRSDIH